MGIKYKPVGQAVRDKDVTEKPRILITRPSTLGEETVKQIELAYPNCFEMTLAPLLRIVEEPADPDISGLQGVLFTSRNAVEVAARRWELTHLPALCVGDATARAAQAAGFSALSAAGDSSTLATLAVQCHLPDAGDFIHLRGAESIGDLAGTLASEGIGLREAIIYDQRPDDLSSDVLDLLAADAYAAVLLYSPRTASLFAQVIGELPPIQPLQAICMSHAVAEALGPNSELHVKIAEKPDQIAMIAALSAL